MGSRGKHPKNPQRPSLPIHGRVTARHSTIATTAINPKTPSMPFQVWACSKKVKPRAPVTWINQLKPPIFSSQAL